MAHTMETRALTADIPSPLADRVDRLAASLERSQGWIIKQALTSWIDREEEQDCLTWAEMDADQAMVARADHGLLLAELNRCRALTPGQLSQPSEAMIRAIRDDP
ncbi:MAG: ribbon-helix-helix domain-containing protein [Magnetococcus sp. DMHC-8]